MYVTFVLGEERVDVLSLLEKALPQKKIQEILTKTGPEAIYIAGKMKTHLHSELTRC